MEHSKIEVSDTLVLFIDLQAGIADLPLTVPYARLRKGVFALSRLAHRLAMPAIVSAVMGQDGSPARIMPEIAQGLGELPVYSRTTADSFENQTLKQAIEATGRKTILIAATATEVAVQLPALSGSDMGYRVFIVIDAVAGKSRAHGRCSSAPHRRGRGVYRRRGSAFGSIGRGFLATDSKACHRDSLCNGWWSITW